MKQTLFILALFSNGFVIGQTSWTLSDFSSKSSTLPVYYKTVIFNPSGWNFEAVLFEDDGSISTNADDIGYRNHIVFLNKELQNEKIGTHSIKGRNLISYGDYKGVDKIIAVDSTKLVIQTVVFTKGPSKKTHKGLVEEQTFIKRKVKVLFHPSPHP